MGLGKTCVTTEQLDQTNRPPRPHDKHQRPERRGRTQLKYLSCLSHDLNNNLAAIHLHLELLKERIGQSPEFTDVLGFLDAAKQSIRRTTDGMQQLLTHERLCCERSPLRSDPIVLRDLVTRIVLLFSASAAKKGIELELTVAPDAVVNSDANLIALVLQNLMGNAIKFSGRGTVRILSYRLPTPRGDRCAVSIADQGPGIPPRHQEQIFDAFWRGEARGNQGIGLGLAIAAAATKRLGAELSVESQVGAGTTFHLIFPAVANRAEVCDRVSERSESGAHPFPASGETRGDGDDECIHNGTEDHRAACR